MFKPAKGKGLDQTCAELGIVRRRWLWILKESDNSLGIRALEAIRNKMQKDLAEYFDDIAKRAFGAFETPTEKLDHDGALTAEHIIEVRDLMREKGAL